MQDSQITDKEEILNLFRILVHEKIPFYIRTGLREHSVKIIKIKNEKIIIDTAGSFSKHSGFVNLFFLYDNYAYFGQLKIIDITDLNEVVAETPSLIFKRKQRKHKRVSAKNKIFCTFNVISSDTEQESKSRHAPFFLRNIYDELNKNTPDIKKIFPAVLDELKKMSDLREIKLYKQDTELTNIEKIISNYKKALFIQDTNDVRNYMIEYGSPFFMTYAPVFQNKIKNNGWDQSQITEVSAKLMGRDRGLSRFSYIYIPIIKFGKVIGHLYSAFTYKSDKKITPKNALYLKALADIIGEALTKNTLFRAEEEQSKISVENISLGGIMITVTDPYILKYLKENVKLSFNAEIDKKELEFTGQIVRVEKQQNGVNIGIKFLELIPKYEKIIKDFVEEKSSGELFP